MNNDDLPDFRHYLTNGLFFNDNIPDDARTAFFVLNNWNRAGIVSEYATKAILNGLYSLIVLLNEKEIELKEKQLELENVEGELSRSVSLLCGIDERIEEIKSALDSHYKKF
jgi:hypothetical protein